VPAVDPKPVPPPPHDIKAAVTEPSKAPDLGSAAGAVVTDTAKTPDKPEIKPDLKTPDIAKAPDKRHPPDKKPAITQKVGSNPPTNPTKTPTKPPEIKQPEPVKDSTVKTAPIDAGPKPKCDPFNAMHGCSDAKPPAN